MLIKSKKTKTNAHDIKKSYSDEKNIDHLTFKKEVRVSKPIFSSSYIRMSPLIRQSDNTIIIYTLWNIVYLKQSLYTVLYNYLPTPIQKYCFLYVMYMLIHI